MADSSSRKRVCKACDSCRLRKTKCDGKMPCSRCEVDNGICVFGNRMKFRNGVYPKGYVEKLLQDREMLASGVQELYKRLQHLHGWSGPLPKNLVSGQPHVHSILDGLGILASNMEEEDTIPPEPITTTVLEGDTNLHNNLHVTYMNSPSETPFSTTCKVPAAVDLTRPKALNPYHVFTGSVPLPTPPTDKFVSSLQIACQGTIQQDDDQSLSPFEQRETSDDVQSSDSAVMQTEEYYNFLYVPGSSDSYLSPNWIHTPTEQYDDRVQQTPLYPQHSSTTQLGKQLDYFSLELDHSTDVSSTMEFFADFEKVLERKLFSWGEPEHDKEALCR